ncbi:transposase [Flavobacterium flavigenum]|uniref:transposase n=1 Tax=Flavobacterium flavigenum TaxID=3003258 RepID=UPI0022AC0639|nr:transposase [Flavobacterium flavigenum]
MENSSNYVKRSQRDYSMSLKLQIVSDIEKGFISITQARKQYGIQSRSTVVQWLIKFGNFDWENQSPIKMAKTPEQKIMELEAQVKLLEKQKAFLEKQAFVADKKVILFDMMIDLAEKEYHIDIRKNSVPEQSTNSEKKNEKQ